MPWWTLVATVAMVRASFPIFCYISKIQPRYIATQVIYFPQSRGNHWKNERSSRNTGIWNKDLTDPRVTLQEVTGTGWCLWLLLSRSHTETQSVCICDSASFLLSIHPEKYFKTVFLFLYLNFFPFVFLVLYKEQWFSCFLGCRALPSPNIFCKWHVCV